MAHVLDYVAKEAGGNAGPGRPGVVAGTASPTHFKRRELFGSLGVPVGAKPEETMNGGATAPVPSVTIFDEKPEHTIMCLLKARGYTYEEIAVETGYTPQHVRTVCIQPWARRKIQAVQKDGIGDAKNFLAGQLIHNLELVQEIADDTKNPPSVRLAAANANLDRFLGKPSTSVTNDKPKVEAQSLDDLERELNELKSLEGDIIARKPKRDPQSIVIDVTETATKVDARK